MIVVSAATPLRHLIAIGRALGPIFWRLFGKVIVPTAVLGELQHDSTSAAVRTWVDRLPGWVEVRSPSDSRLQRSDRVHPPPARGGPSGPCPPVISIAGRSSTRRGAFLFSSRTVARPTGVTPCTEASCNTKRSSQRCSARCVPRGMRRTALPAGEGGNIRTRYPPWRERERGFAGRITQPGERGRGGPWPA